MTDGREMKDRSVASSMESPAPSTIVGKEDVEDNVEADGPAD